jgi:hypothetical protein
MVVGVFLNIPKVLVAIPSYNAVQPYPFIHFLTFSQETGRAEATGKYIARMCVPGKVKTVVARNAATRIAVSDGADLLLLIDDDMSVPPDVIERLMAHDVDIVVPIFFKPSTVEPLIYEFDKLGCLVPMFNYPENCLFEVPAAAGTGVMMIKTEVLKAMDEPIWVGSVDPTYAEDVEFCRKAKKLGFKIWCDSSVKVDQMSAPEPIGERHYKRLT